MDDAEETCPLHFALSQSPRSPNKRKSASPPNRHIPIHQKWAGGIRVASQRRPHAVEEEHPDDYRKNTRVSPLSLSPAYWSEGAIARPALPRQQPSPARMAGESPF